MTDFPGRWAEGVSLTLAPVLLLAGVLLRAGPAPRWWAVPLALAAGAGAVVIGVLG